jgi:hypothetical protein
MAPPLMITGSDHEDSPMFLYYTNNIFKVKYSTKKISTCKALKQPTRAENRFNCLHGSHYYHAFFHVGLPEYLHFIKMNRRKECRYGKVVFTEEAAWPQKPERATLPAFHSSTVHRPGRPTRLLAHTQK